MAVDPYENTSPDVAQRDVIRPLAPPTDPHDVIYEEGVRDGIHETESQIALKLAQKAMHALNGDHKTLGVHGKLAMLELKVDSHSAASRAQNITHMSALENVRRELSKQSETQNIALGLKIDNAVLRIEARRMNPWVFAFLVGCAAVVAYASYKSLGL